MGTANCPETPRQKMIGMMYLFYTALLALNVSGEIINAFVLVNDSLKQTTENFHEKTNGLYGKLNSLKELQPEKYKPVFDEAMEVKDKTDKLVKDIERLKLEMVKQADGPEGSLDNIKKKDNLDAGPELMTGTGGPMKGDSLEMWVDNYRDFVLSHEVVSRDTSSALYHNIMSALATEDDLSDPEEKKTWDEKLFNGMPLVGSVAMLTKLQADIRNSEAELVENMIIGVDELNITITDIEAVVNAKTSYVVKGGKYEAEVFIAARDTSMKPTVYYTSQAPFFDSTESGFGKLKNVQYDTMPIVNGKGQYIINNPPVGSRSYGGVIEWKSKRGTMYLPFQTDYMVGESGLAVSPTGLNVFYRGIDNPVEISVSGYPKEKVSAGISGGATFASSGGQRVVRITSNTTRNVNISVSVRTESGTKHLGTKKFRVLNVPTPIAKFNGTKSQGPIYKDDLRTGFIAASLGEQFFPFDVKFSVVSFSFAYKVRGQKKRIQVYGNRLNAEAKQALNGLGRGTQINFESIKVKGPSGTKQTAPITLELR